jgi:hypothetical protein
MSEITRRDAVRRLALALTTAGFIDRFAAEEVHAMASQAAAGGTYTPKTFTAAQFKTLERLADIIIPVEDGKPGRWPPRARHGSTRSRAGTTISRQATPRDSRGWTKR